MILAFVPTSSRSGSSMLPNHSPIQPRVRSSRAMSIGSRLSLSSSDPVHNSPGGRGMASAATRLGCSARSRESDAMTQDHRETQQSQFDQSTNNQQFHIP